MDRLLDIATGTSRKTKKWKNKQTTWADLSHRLENVTRTGETVAEYNRMGRDRQSAIKDVGGFVGDDQGLESLEAILPVLKAEGRPV